MTRRRSRSGTSPLVWIVIVVAAAGLSALGVVIAARGSDSAPPAATASASPPTKTLLDAAPERLADCDALHEAIRTISDQTARRELPADVADHYRRTITPKMVDAFVASCKADAWPAEVRACAAIAETDVANQRCLEKLPKDTRDRLRVATNRVIESPPSSIASTQPDPACASAAAGYVTRLQAAIRAKPRPGDKRAIVEANIEVLVRI